MYPKIISYSERKKEMYDAAIYPVHTLYTAEKSWQIKKKSVNLGLDNLSSSDTPVN